MSLHVSPRSYAFEALLISEFSGAVGFRFTGYHQPGTPPDQVGGGFRLERGGTHAA